MAPEPERHVDPESFLEDFRASGELIGLSAPPPEMELVLVDAIDAANEWMSCPYPALPPRRARVVAFLRGIVAALAEDGLKDLYHYAGDGREAEQRAWKRAYHGTHKLTLGRFAVYACTGCHRRVHDPGTDEHDPGCRMHVDHYGVG